MALFSPYVLILVPLVLFVGHVYGEKLPFSIGEGEKGCDLFQGKWVRDDVSRPLYQESECPYIDPALTCQGHGRPDKEYLYWKWQPTGCSLASFNASLVLETLRGKRMLYAGDSLSRGQYNSMICLLQSIIPEHSKTLTINGSYTVFTAKDYNATIEHYWAPYLLESNSDGSLIHNLSDRVVRKDSIDQYGDHWKGVDIMVLDTYIWWMVGPKINILEGSFNDKVQKIVPVVVEDAYRMGMKNMLKWVKENMDPKKTRVFFMSMSPTHMRSSEWGGDEKGNCYNETHMIQNSTYWGSDTRKSIMQVVKEEFSQSQYPIELLNITQLSSYRKDAHSSIYKERNQPLTPQQLANPVSYADCIHYCLPGLQDIWNELLFAKLFYP